MVAHCGSTESSATSWYTLTKMVASADLADCRSWVGRCSRPMRRRIITKDWQVDYEYFKQQKTHV
jgi:hypothetical protein